MATPGFMFTFSSAFSPQVCVYSALKILWTVSLWARVAARCIHSFTCTALAFTSACSMFSRSAPARTPSAFQLPGLLTHLNLTSWVPRGDLITQPTLTWTVEPPRSQELWSDFKTPLMGHLIKPHGPRSAPSLSALCLWASLGLPSSSPTPCRGRGENKMDSRA